MRHIMVATDRSGDAERALDFAVELTKTIGGKLSIIAIGDDLRAEELRPFARAGQDVSDSVSSLATEVLADAERRARYLGVTDVRVLTGLGDVATTIIEIAKHQAADAIVVGRRGRGQLAGLLLGSVSQKLVSLAPCAVIVVP
jgi:nucleotide-binding universal stress UspA family protein